MTFRYYPRYVNFILLIGFDAFITFFFKFNFACIIFYIITIILGLLLFGIKYVMVDNSIGEYFFFIKMKKIDISDIKKVQIVTVKEIGRVYFYIGKKANENKETGYYLEMKDGKRVKLDSGYQNKSGITIGKYIIQNYKLWQENVEKYKWFNDNL